MDFAYSKNGYVYHTKYDTLDIHPNGTLQNTGDNIMELIKALGNADELENVNEHEDGKLVFFDFMTWFLIYYTQGIGILINCLIIVAALCVIGGAAYMITRNNGEATYTTYYFTILHWPYCDAIQVYRKRRSCENWVFLQLFK